MKFDFFVSRNVVLSTIHFSTEYLFYPENPLFVDGIMASKRNINMKIMHSKGGNF